MGEINLQNSILDLVESIKDIENPSLVANKISYFLSDILRGKMINLYEAYLLNWEEINYRRKGYIEKGWNGRVRISTCLAILNQRFLAQIFNDGKAADKLKAYGLEAMELNCEKRSHYIMDRYLAFLDAKDSSELLKELLKIRKNYHRLGDTKGPFHNEVFPYDFYNPERALLENDYNVNEKTIDKKLENLIIELNIR